MKIETAYFGRPVHAPGKGPSRTTDTHFNSKAGFEIELNEQTGWVSVERHGEVRLVPPTNVTCLIPAAQPKPAAKAAPAKGKPAPGLES